MVPSMAPPPSHKFHLFTPHVGHHLSFGAQYLPVHAIQSFTHHLAFCAPRPGPSCRNQDLPGMSAGSHGQEWRGCYRIQVSLSLPFHPPLFLNCVLEPFLLCYLVNRFFMSTASSVPSVMTGSLPTPISFSSLMASPSVQTAHTTAASAISPSSMKLS